MSKHLGITDAEFIACWNRHLSAKKVADELGMNVRTAQHRRRHLEAKLDVHLRTHDPRPAYNEAPVSDASKAVIRWNVENGVILVGSDAHLWPGSLTTVQRAFLYFVKHFDPAPVAVVLNGDIFDGASISRHPGIGWEAKPSVKQELEAVQNFLSEIEKHRRNAKLFWPQGNHDLRFASRLAATASEFEGVAGFDLLSHFPAWSPCWRVDINDDLVIKHRMANGLHAVYNNTLRSGRSMVTGHLHSLKVTPWTDYNGTRYGVDTGTLAEPTGPQFENYLESGPTNWRSGFAVLTICDGRLLIPELVQAWDETHVQFRGQLLEV